MGHKYEIKINGVLAYTGRNYFQKMLKMDIIKKMSEMDFVKMNKVEIIITKENPTINFL